MTATIHCGWPKRSMPPSTNTVSATNTTCLRRSNSLRTSCARSPTVCAARDRRRSQSSRAAVLTAWPRRKGTSGRFSLVDITPIASEALASNLQACGGCDIQFGIPRANLSADLKSRLAPSLSLSFLPPSFEPPARARPLTPLCPCLFQFDGFDERGQRRASRAHRGGGAAGCNLVFRPIGIAARLQSTNERLARVAGIVANDQCAGEISQVSDLRAD